jgi:hypothetical protein
MPFRRLLMYAMRKGFFVRKWKGRLGWSGDEKNTWMWERLMR